MPERNRFFTGREEELEALHTALSAGDTAALTANETAALRGMGGIGKTQTAIEYAHRHRLDYAILLWARAEDEVTLRESFRELAAKLDLPEKNAPDASDVVRAMLRWLEANTGWLLVLDNADDLLMARQYFRRITPDTFS